MRPGVDGASASYAAEVARLLWPEPWEPPHVTRSRPRPGPTRREAYLFPDERRPRLLVPVDVPGSSVMLRRLGPGRSGLAGPARVLLERSVRSGALRVTRWPVLTVRGTDPGSDSVERYLGEHLGTEVRVGVLLGTRRVNQKPVLQLFGPDGSNLGYAKVGHNDLTAGLVRREAEALVTVRGRLPRSFRLPRLLHHGSWAGLEILVMSPLATATGQPVTRAVRLAATREVTALGDPVSVPLAESAFWSRLRSAAARLPADGGGVRLQEAVATIEERHGSDPVSLGCWHGDWGHWNMGMGRGVLKVWDWERFDPAVPVGFDALHFAAQAVRPGDREAPRQESAFLRSAPALLAELGVRPAHHDLTVRLYLAEIAVRYLEALSHGATPALRARSAWVVSLLHGPGRDLSPALPGGRP